MQYFLCLILVCLIDMNKFHQLHERVIRISTPHKSVVRFGDNEVSYLSVAQVDQFFAQPANRTPEGWIDTSPISASTPSAESHVMPVDAKKYSSKMPVEDLFETTVSKHCQTMAEVGAMAKCLRKPVKEDYEEVEEPVEPVTSASAPAN